MMGRPLGSEDQDLDFLDTIISRQITILHLTHSLTGLTDDNDVLETTLDIHKHAAMTQKHIIDYRPRLDQMKAEIRELRREVARLKATNRALMKQPVDLPPVKATDG